MRKTIYKEVPIRPRPNPVKLLTCKQRRVLRYYGHS